MGSMLRHGQNLENYVTIVGVSYVVNISKEASHPRFVVKEYPAYRLATKLDLTVWNYLD
jgi:hypothetical protein